MPDAPCPRCLAGAAPLSAEQITRIAEGLPLPPPLRAEDAVQAARLAHCAACGSLRGGVLCAHCGCFVQIRARPKAAYCPHPAGDRWKAYSITPSS